MPVYYYRQKFTPRPERALYYWIVSANGTPYAHSAENLLCYKNQVIPDAVRWLRQEGNSEINVKYSISAYYASSNDVAETMMFMRTK